MSNFEIFLIVMACAVPIVALLMVLPKLKLKKKEKTTRPETKTYVEMKGEDKPADPKVEEKPKEVVKPLPSNDISTDDFKSYLDNRKPISKPSKIELPNDFVDRSMPYMPQRRRLPNKKRQSVAEEFQNLSPELKALIIAGVLDRKDY